MYKKKGTSCAHAPFSLVDEIVFELELVVLCECQRDQKLHRYLLLVEVDDLFLFPDTDVPVPSQVDVSELLVLVVNWFEHYAPSCSWSLFRTFSFAPSWAVTCH